jgi:hypothetical protein
MSTDTVLEALRAVMLDCDKKLLFAKKLFLGIRVAMNDKCGPSAREEQTTC